MIIYSIPIAGNKVPTKIDLTSMHFADISIGQCPPKKKSAWILNQAFLEQFREVFNAHYYKSYKSKNTIHTLHLYISSMCSIYNVPSLPSVLFEAGHREVASDLAWTGSCESSIGGTQPQLPTRLVGWLVGWKWFLEHTFSYHSSPTMPQNFMLFDF